MRYYRTTVLVSAIAWFMVGMHVPAIHDITGHGAAPSAGLIGAIALIVATALGGLWLLLRMPAQSPGA